MYIIEVPVACAAHLAQLASLISAGARQPPLYTDTPAGPQDLVRPPCMQRVRLCVRAFVCLCACLCVCVCVGVRVCVCRWV